MAAVARFNDRLKAAGRKEEMLLNPALPGEAQYRPQGFPVYRRMIIAEDGQEVRAAMLLCHQNIHIYGKRHDFCWTKLPLSEGIVNQRYALAIIQLIKKTVDIHPFLMGVGGGTPDSDGFRFFSRLKWRYQAIPFFFYPVHLTKVLLGLQYLKNNFRLRIMAKIGAWSGLGIAVSSALVLHRYLSKKLSKYDDTVIDSFGDWASDVFLKSLPYYPVAIRSDAVTLNIVYPPDDHRYVRIRVRRKSTQQDAGWIVVATKQMQDNHYFGNLKVGTLVDGFGQPEDVAGLISVGIKRLAEMGADIIVANFSHSAWKDACRRSGMLSGPSNFNLFVSPLGGPILEESCPLHCLHIARGHSDGMDNLI